MKKTVNFIEAVNSGKRFRQAKYAKGWYSFNRNDEMKYVDGKDEVYIPVEFFNSRFELEDKSITITESQLDEVYNNHDIKDYDFVDDLFLAIKKELGF
mgnify:CR=1 FL=1